MKLPNGEKAYISYTKIKAYLLSETHLVGRSKAKLLRSLGFDDSNISLLKQALIFIAQSEDVKEIISSPYCVKYIVEGQIQTPTGGYIKMTTVWIIDKGQERPRFVTTYPA